MKKKRISFVALLVCAALLFSGCQFFGSPTETEGEAKEFFGIPIEKEDGHSIDAIRLRDKKLLYANQDPTEVVTMYLTVSTGNSGENTDHTWEEINTYSAFDYDRMGVERYKVEGLLQVGTEEGLLPGELGYDQVSPNCTVQIRGQTSSKNPQKNYKISIKDNKGTWRGQSTIALNKHQTEGLRFRNKLAFDLMAGIDEMMSLRTTFVHLYVKDTTAGGSGGFQDYGIYTQVEQLNKTALAAHGLDKRGHLYKINEFEFYRYEDIIKLSSDPTYDKKAFEERIEIKGEEDHQKLITMLERLNDYSVPIDTVLDEYFETENLTYWLAFNLLMGNIDTQSRNVYIYSPLNSNKWYFLPWDNDGSLKREENAINQRVDYIEWESGISNYWGNVLFQRALKSESFRKELDEAVEKLRVYLSKERITQMAETYASVVKPYLYRMPDRMYAPLTEANYNRVLAAIPNEIEMNYQYYKESLEQPMPFFIGVPTVKDGKMTVVWDNSYDFNAETISYTFELARDFSFTNVIHREENILIPSVTLDRLPKGQYFVRVRAFNESGQSQYAFDYYVADNDKIYGTKCFYVTSDGKVVEDVYVEG